MSDDLRVSGDEVASGNKCASMEVDDLCVWDPLQRMRIFQDVMNNERQSERYTTFPLIFEHKHRAEAVRSNLVYFFVHPESLCIPRENKKIAPSEIYTVNMSGDNTECTCRSLTTYPLSKLEGKH